MKKLNFISNQVTAGKGTAESESAQKRVKVGEGYIQHIFSIYSAYIGTSRQPAGAQQTTSRQPRPDCVSILCRWSDLAMSGLFSTRALRYAAMILCVLMLGVGQMWGEDITITPIYTGSYLSPGNLVKVTMGSNTSVSSGNIQVNKQTNGSFTISTSAPGMYLKSATFTDTQNGTNKAITNLACTNGSITNSSGTCTYTASASTTSTVISFTGNTEGAAKLGSLQVVVTNGSLNNMETLSGFSFSSGTFSFTAKINNSTVTSAVSLTSQASSSWGASDGNISIPSSSDSKTLTITSSNNIRYVAILDNNCRLTLVEKSSTGGTCDGASWKAPSGEVNSVTFKNGISTSITATKVFVITEAPAAKDYTVTAATSTGDNTYGTVSAGASSLDEGETTTITATPATGYQVTNWAVSGTGASISPSGASNSNTTTLTMGTENATVTATFGPKSYTVTLNNQDATSDGTESVTTTYAANTNLTSAITCPTKTGYVFAGYFTGTNGTGVQLIDYAGNWIASAGGGSTYLDGSKNWKNAGALTLYACWMNYANSLDLQTYVEENVGSTAGDGTQSTDYSILSSNNYFYLLNTASSSTCLDNSDNAAYRGLKFKRSGDYVLFLVPANYSLSVKFGYVKTTKPKYSINGGAESSFSTITLKSDDQSVDMGSETYVRLVKIKAADGDAAVLKTVTITAPSYTWYVRGSFDVDGSGNWQDGEGMTGDGSTLTAEVDLAANTQYAFKIVDTGSSAWHTNTGTIKNSISNWDFSTTGGESNDCHIRTSKAGTYTFSYNTSTNKLSVDYPDSKQVYFYKNGASWSKVYAYCYDDATWNNGWPGVEITSNTECQTFYANTDGYTYIIFNDGTGNTAGTDKTYDITIGDNAGKCAIGAAATGWSAKPTYTISYAGNGGTGTTASNTSIACEGSATLTTNGFSKDGYSFNCWHADVATTVGGAAKAAGADIPGGSSLTNITSDIEMTAQWTQEIPTSASVSGTWAYFPGQTVSITAVPSGGTSGFTYQWQKNKSGVWTNLTNGTDGTDGGTFSGATTANLQISGCTKNNSGSYRCVISKLGASINSSEYTVHVYTLEGGYKGDGSSWTAYDLAYTSGTSGSVAVNLNASSSYEFGIKDNYDNSWYRNTNFIISPWTNEGFGKGSGNCRLFAGPEGDYTFTVDIAHVGDGTPYVNVSVDYPDVTHPVEGYVYIPKNWSKCYVHYWYTDGGGDHALTSWGSDVEVTTYVEDLCDVNYFYLPAIGEYPKVIIKDAAGDPSNTTGNQTTTSNSGKYIKHDGSSWGWNSFTTYSITFAANGGSNSMSAINDICPSSDQALTANAYAKTGYNFAGWKTNTALSYVPYGGGDAVNVAVNGIVPDKATIKSVGANITLTAQWTEITHTVTVAYKCGETTIKSSGSVSGAGITTAQSVTAPSITGYAFSTWSSMPSGVTTSSSLTSATISIKATADSKTITANYTANEYNITYKDEGDEDYSGSNEASLPDTHTYGSATELVDGVKSGYTFGGWFTDEDCDGDAVTSLGATDYTDDITLYAKWTETAYTLSYSIGTGATGSASGGTSAGSYAEGTTITTPAKGTLAKSGYTFVGWSDGTTLYLAGQTFSMPASDVTLTAVWDGAGTSVTLTHFGKQYYTSGPRRGYAYVGSTSGTKYIIESDESSHKNIDSDSSAIQLVYSNKYIKVLGPNATTDLSDSLFTGVTEISFKWKYCGSTTTYTTDIDIYVGSTKVGTKSLTGNKNDAYVTATLSNIASKNGAVKFVNTGTSSSNQKFYIDDITITCGTPPSGKTVTFADGSTAPDSHTTWPDDIEGVPSGKKILQPANPTAPNYTFGGWYTDAACTSAFSFSGTITKDTTLYAKWAAKTQPTLYSVSGSSYDCGGKTASIILSGSQSGVSYQLKDNGSNVGDAVSGTGSMLRWDDLPAGEYTVWAVENATYAERQMTNTVTVEEYSAASVTGITGEGTPKVVAALTNVQTDLTVTATGDGLEYQWQTCTDAEGSDAANLTTGSEYSGFTGATLSITATTSGTRYFRCKVSGTCGDPDYSEVVTVNITASYLLTYDANNGSGAPSATYLAAGSAALSSTVPIRSGYRFLGWNTKSDGSGTRYASGASFTMGTSAVTLYAEWQEVATITYVLDVTNKGTTLQTITGTGSSNAHITASTSTSLLAGGLGTGGKNADKGSHNGTRTLGINVLSEETVGKYFYVTFSIAENYELVPTAITIKGISIGGTNTNNYKAVLTDGSNQLVGTTSTTNDSEWTIGGWSGLNSTALTGTVTLKLYAWYTSSSSFDAYRLSTPITIAGDVNYICPDRPTITSPASAQAIKLYTDERKTLSVSVTKYDDDKDLSYQWQKNGVDIDGATSESYTVVGSGLTAGTTYAYTCNVSEEDACVDVVTSPAFNITAASPDCGYTEIASAVLTSKSDATLNNATLLVNGLADISSGSCKLNGKGAYFGLQLASGSFQVGDSIVFKIKMNNSDEIYLFATTDTTGLQTTDAIYTQSVTSGDNIIKFVVTSGSMLTALNTSKKVAVVRRTKDGVLNQNHSVYYAKVKRYTCPDIVKFDDAKGTGLWSDEDNWIGVTGHGAEPTINDRIVLTKSMVVDVTNAQVKEVVLDQSTDNSVSLEIQAGKALVVAESVKVWNGSSLSATDYNDINIGSTLAAGTGALVMGSHDGTNKATVNFASKAKKDGSGNWINQFIGTPYNDVTDVQYNYYGMQLYEFKADGSGTTTSEWTKLRNGNGMTAFMGYNLLCKQTTDQTLWMQGTLVTSANQTLSGYKKAGADSTENMFANSWLAPIHMDKFEDDDFTNIEKTIYIFNAGSPADQASHTSDGSATATAAGQYIVLPIKSATWLSATVTVIPSMQAFSVYAKGSSPSLKLDYSRLVYTPALTSVGVVPTRVPRKAKAETDAPDKLRLTISAESGYGANIYVFGREDFSEGFDDGWDGRHIAGDDAAPQLYAVTADGNMAIHCTPELEGTLIGFKAGEADSEYTFAFEYDGDAEALYLLDTYTNAYTRVLTGNSYHFGASDNAAHNRFILTYYAPGVATGVENGELLNGADGVRKVLIDDQLYIFRAGKMFNATGALVK